MKLKNSGLDQLVIKKPITITPDTSLVDTRQALLKHKLSRLVVVDQNDKPVGIITEKDVAKTFYNLGNRSVKSIKAKQFMSKNLLTVKKENSIYNCATIMRNRKISSVIIINDDLTLAGLVTKTDLASIFLTKAIGSLKVSQVMTRKVITVSPSDSLLYVESVLINHRISRLVVIRDKRPVGIITHRDFIPARLPQWISESADPKEVTEYKYSSKPFEARVNQMAYLLPFNAVDIMSTNPITIKPNEGVEMAVLLMIRHDIGGLPVVKNSKIIGIITKSDIVNAIAEQ